MRSPRGWGQHPCNKPETQKEEHNIKEKNPKQLNNNKTPTMQDFLKSQRPLTSRTGTKHSIAVSELLGDTLYLIIPVFHSSG